MKTSDIGGSRISIRFIVIFGLLAAGIIAIGCQTYRGYEKHCRTDAEQQLAAIAALKMSELVKWRSERIGDAYIVFGNPSFSNLVRRYFRSPHDRESEQQLRDFLGKYTVHYEYDQVRLLDPQGVSRLALPLHSHPPPVSAALATRIAEVIRSKRVTIVDFYRHEHDQRIYLSLLIPIIDKAAGNRAIGIASLRVDPEKYIYPYILHWPGTSGTAETLIVRHEGDGVLFLNNLRFKRDAALNFRIPLEKTDTPAVKAVLGQTGIVEGHDYRNMAVIADVRGVPGSPWFLVTRMDLAEVYAPVHGQLPLILGLMLALLFGAGSGLAFAWRQQSVVFYREQYRTEEALRLASSQNELILNAAGEGICGMDAEGKIMFANPAAAELCGYQVGELIGAQMHSLLHYAYPDGSPYPREECPHFITLRQGIPCNKRDEVFWRKDGSSFHIAFTSSPIRDGDMITGAVVTFRDITGRRKMEERERLARIVLERLTQVEDTKDTICDILHMIKQTTGFEAVGIRLRKGDDFPYFVQDGFSNDFLLTENSLAVKDSNGCVCRNKAGKISLVCTCGLVISGQTDPANPIFTPGGSFWTNDSLSLLDLPADRDPRLYPRNICIHEGYSSFALLPLRVGKEVVGLLQLNDRRKDQFTPEMIQFFEVLCSNIGMAIARKWVEDEKKQLILESYTKEMELMKYREKYNITQQENAFTKELNIIKDDLFLKRIDVVNSRGKEVEWVIDMYYKPLDILSGDSYSIREIEEGKVLIYLADAMGKGLAASVTSILSTSFVNHLVNEAKEAGSFDFRGFVDAYSKIIRRELIEEEILCVKFIFLDLVGETMDVVICAMPPALCHSADNTIVRIENNNMPLMVYPAEMRIDSFDISNFHKILAHTDGLNESFRTEDSIYQEYLEEDFRQSEFGNHLMGRFNSAIKKPDDDVSFIFLRRIDRTPKWTKVFTIAARLEEVAAVAGELEAVFETLEADAEFKVMFINAFNEIVMNAYEHGSLNIDLEHKARLVQDDTYQDYLLKAEKEIAKNIIVTLSLQELNRNDYMVVTVTDEGAGFDTSLLNKTRRESDFFSLNGRGVQMAQCLTDELFYNRAGNEATLLKRIARG